MISMLQILSMFYDRIQDQTLGKVTRISSIRSY